MLDDAHSSTGLQTLQVEKSRNNLPSCDCGAGSGGGANRKTHFNAVHLKKVHGQQNTLHWCKVLFTSYGCTSKVLGVVLRACEKNTLANSRGSDGTRLPPRGACDTHKRPRDGVEGQVAVSWSSFVPPPPRRQTHRLASTTAPTCKTAEPLPAAHS
jgi:hypothetical protein